MGGNIALYINNYILYQHMDAFRLTIYSYFTSPDWLSKGGS